MLEQAIIDATALKEAAVKNAETLVLEKYSNQIKNAVESLLEQEDPLASLAAVPAEAAPAGLADPMAMADPAAMGADPAAMGADPAAMGMPAGPGPAPFEVSSVLKYIPMAATTKSDESIEIPLDKLMEEIRAVKKQVLSEEPYYDSLEEELDEDLFEELEEEAVYEELYGATDEELEEEFELTEEDLTEIVENLVVDIEPRKSGWAGTPEATLRFAEEELLALQQDSDVKERRNAMRKAVESLGKVNETVVRQNNKLQTSVEKSTKQIKKLTNVSMLLKEKLDKVNLLNAKLLYQNKALTSDSLNERQKHKLAEAVTKADSIEEARVIYETLQSTVGSTSRKKSQPESLSEAVQKTSSIILSSRGNESKRRQSKDPTYNRWKFLAGIDKQ